MKEIPLTKGRVALVDDEDYEWLSQYRWITRLQGPHKIPYACRTVRVLEDGIKKSISINMHREILGLSRGDNLHGDHINHDTLDNQRHNLRIATSSQNQGNAQKHKIKSSRYKGVAWAPKYNKWVAYICAHGKYKHLGYYDTPELAADAYNAAALEVFGEFAHLNTIAQYAEEVEHGIYSAAQPELCGNSCTTEGLCAA